MKTKTINVEKTLHTIPFTNIFICLIAVALDIFLFKALKTFIIKYSIDPSLTAWACKYLDALVLLFILGVGGILYYGYKHWKALKNRKEVRFFTITLVLFGVLVWLLVQSYGSLRVLDPVQYLLMEYWNILNYNALMLQTFAGITNQWSAVADKLPAILKEMQGVLDKMAMVQNANTMQAAIQNSSFLGQIANIILAFTNPFGLAGWW